MKKVSFVLAGRLDDYGSGFLHRFKFAWNLNINRLVASEIDWEIIFVDYNPEEDNYMYKEREVQDIFQNERVKTIIVDRSVVIKENLNPLNYYDYFAKNVGLRKASGDSIVSTNTDLIFSEELINEIKINIEDPEIDKYFYRTRYRRDSVPEWIYAGKWERCAIFDCYKPEHGDSVICGCYSGDFIMMSSNSFIDKACGYNECNEGHRTSFPQCGMDGEIGWNAYDKGMRMKLLNGHYFHIGHDKPGKYDIGCVSGNYNNKKDWGLISYNEYQLDDRVFYIRP